MNVSVARRYARALLEALSDSAQLDTAADQLGALADTLRTQPELRELFSSPTFSKAQRTAVAEGLLQSLGNVPKALDGLIRLLSERDRLLILPDIARLFHDLADQRLGRLRGEVTSAVPLPPDLLRSVEQSLEKATQRDVVLTAKVEPLLVGGVTARVGSLLFDGSLRTQLEDLRTQLKQ